MGASQFQFARDDCLSKISLADKDGHNIDRIAFHHSQDFAHGGLFLPKAAVNFAEDSAFANDPGVGVRRRARVRVQCRAVPDQESMPNRKTWSSLEKLGANFRGVKIRSRVCASSCAVVRIVSGNGFDGVDGSCQC